MPRGTLKQTVSRASHWDIMPSETMLLSQTFWTMMIGKKIQHLPVTHGVNVIGVVANQRSNTLDNTYNQMLDWLQQDPGLHQTSYLDK